MAPIVIDLVVARYYVTTLFNVYGACTTLIVGISYVWITIKLSNWTQSRRRIYKEKTWTESNVVNESFKKKLANSLVFQPG